MAEPTVAAPVAELADFYRHLCTSEFDGYCDLYAAIGRGMAGDDDLLARVVDLGPATKLIPILLFAAVHDLALREPDLPLAAIYRGGPGDPWPAFRAVLESRWDEIAAVVAVRTIQTNEVGRSGVLVPAIEAALEDGERRVALVEIGASAGLNLLLDRFGYRYTDGDGDGDGATTTAGRPDSPVQLTCEVRGPLHPPVQPDLPTITARLGIDLAPVDSTDEREARWLEACVWPLVPDRAARLRAAIDLARTDPPPMRAGDAADLLDTALAAQDPDVLVCVVSTWMLSYVSPDGRGRLADVLDAHGRTRELAWITAEYPGIAPWVDRPGRESAGAPSKVATVLGLSRWRSGPRTSRPLAWVQAHGQWIDWLDPSTAGATTAT
jgi:hypothetical protein